MMRNRIQEAAGEYTWTYVAQYVTREPDVMGAEDLYEGIHSSEDNRLGDGYGRTLEEATGVALDFVEPNPDNESVQRTITVCVRQVPTWVTHETSVFEFPIVVTYDRRGEEIESRWDMTHANYTGED